MATPIQNVAFTRRSTVREPTHSLCPGGRHHILRRNMHALHRFSLPLSVLRRTSGVPSTMAPKVALRPLAQETSRCMRPTAMTAQVQFRDGSVVANRRQNDDAANQKDNDELKDRHLPTRPAAQDTNDHKQEKVTENSVNNSAHGTFTWLMGKSRERQRCERQPQPLPAPAERRHEYPETKVAWRTPPLRVWLSREGIRDAVSAYNGTSWLGGDTLIAKVFNEALTYKELNLATPDGCGTERNGHDRRCAGALNALVLHIKRLIRRVELRFRQDAEHVGQPESTRRQPRSLVRSATSVFENSGLPQLQWRHLPWKQNLRSAH